MSNLLALFLSVAAAQPQTDHARQDRLYRAFDAAVQGEAWTRLAECVDRGRTVFTRVGKDGGVTLDCAMFMVYGRPVGVSLIAALPKETAASEEDASAAAGMLVAHYRDLQAQARAYQMQIDIGEAFQRMAR